MGLIELSDVSVRFVGLKALTNVSFSVARGEIKAVIGPNGAGKSTLFNAITGYVRPSEGTILFEGRNISGLKPHIVSGLGMRRTFQNGGVFAGLTVVENVLAGLHEQTPSRALGIVFGSRAAFDIEADATDAALKLMRDIGIAELRDRRAADLSSGQQRLVEITRAMAARTKLLLLDEPAVGLSLAERQHLVEVLRKIAATGVAVLLVEHAIDLVISVSHRIVVLNHGEVIAHGEPDEIRNDPKVLEAYLGHG